MNWPTEEDYDRLVNAPLVPFYINGMDMLALLHAVHLALRDKRFGMPYYDYVRIFAQDLEQRILDAAPAFEDICAAKWADLRPRSSLWRWIG